MALPAVLNYLLLLSINIYSPAVGYVAVAYFFWTSAQYYISTSRSPYGFLNLGWNEFIGPQWVSNGSADSQNRSYRISCDLIPALTCRLVTMRSGEMVSFYYFHNNLTLSKCHIISHMMISVMLQLIVQTSPTCLYTYTIQALVKGSLTLLRILQQTREPH